MAEDTMYRFTFDKPVEFKRVYNFISPFAPSNKLWLPQEFSDSYIASTNSFERIFNFNEPDHPFNSYWVTEDSNPSFIKLNSYKVKKTLVKNLYIAFSPKHHKYEITLSDDFGYKDDFYVSITEFPNFLKRVGLL